MICFAIQMILMFFGAAAIEKSILTQQHWEKDLFPEQAYKKDPGLVEQTPLSQKGLDGQFPASK